MTTFRLPAGDVTIGRDAGCVVRLEHASVGERHATLRVGPTLTLTDLGSGQATRVGARVLSPGEAAGLGPGVIFTLGKVSMSVHLTGMSVGFAVERPRPPSIVPQGAMDRLRRDVERVAASSISILLQGETGVGKEVMANAIHAASPRRDKPLLCLNCAALSESLLEGELLGYERGAFTGALRAKPGLLESADGGTVFLDELGELPLSIQAKLLRVVEQKQVTRLGSLTPRSIDVRFLGASNRDLAAEVERGAFRRDLYFRLNGFSIHIPPLRERVAEIAVLARTFVEQAAEGSGRPSPRLSLDAVLALERHPWPGNVRELRHVIERAVVLARTDVIDAPGLLLSPAPATPSAPSVTLSESESEGETDAGALRQRTLEALEKCAGNQTKAAQLLGISRRTLITRIERYGLPRPKKG
jgi:transcriptional regulator with GAF, ATPase, and Fis domain